MPVFRRVEPELRSLIAYIVSRAIDKGITLNRTKLVKLLYLIDVERARSRRDALTGLDWVFFHYGPYAFALIDTLEAMEGAELATSRFRESILYRAAPDAGDGTEWPAGTKSMVDGVIDRFAPMELNELLDHVYFHTGPMMNAQRGQPLDLSKARDDRDERLRRPLTPPSRPAEVEETLAAWRERNAQRLAPVVLIRRAARSTTSKKASPPIPSAVESTFRPTLGFKSIRARLDRAFLRAGRSED